MGERLRDSDVRHAAFGRLLRHARKCPNTRIVPELGVGHGACRVDIAVINGHIRGFEIKSESDVLDRLPHQVQAYGKVVDRATLIVAPRHLEGASRIIPDWWGILLTARAANGAIAFRRLRDERANRSVDPLMVARLLWRPEAVALLKELGRPERQLRQPREALYQELAAGMPLRALAHRVRETLKVRAAWRDHPEPL